MVAPVLAIAGVLGPGRAAVVGRISLVYGFVLAALRILGKRDLSQLRPFDAVLLFLIPQIFRNYLVGSDDTLVTALVASTTLFALVFLTSLLAFRSRTIGRIVRAGPSVLVREGTLIERALDQERVAPEEIEAAARMRGVEALDQIGTATLETEGTISILARRLRLE
jgi:uncharacterized membrane protein YcaP (DUF421 family)